MPSLRVIGNLTSSPVPALANFAIANGVLDHLAQLIDHQKQIIRKETAWLLANITADSAEQVELCLQAGLIKSLILHL